MLLAIALSKANSKMPSKKKKPSLIMSDLAYLQDPIWLAEREQKWQILAKEWLSEKPKEEVASRKAYFFDGNIKHLPTVFTINSFIHAKNLIYQKLFEKGTPNTTIENRPAYHRHFTMWHIQLKLTKPQKTQAETQLTLYFNERKEQAL